MVLSLASCNGQITATIQTLENTPTFTPKIVATATSTIPPFVATRFAWATRHAPTAMVLAQNASSDCNGYPDEMWKPYDQIFSPSGIWRIAYCQYPDTGANYTRVINTKTGESWQVPYLDQEGLNRPEGMTGGQMYFDLWSSDERYAYFKRYYCCLDGPNMIFSNGSGLYQLDLSNGKVRDIDKGKLSPDGYSVIFHEYGNPQVVVRDLKTDQMTPFNFGIQFNMAGVFKWSLDGNKIVFSAADENWFETGSGFALFLVDVKEHTIRQLLFDPPRNYIALDWLSDTEILLGEARGSENFILNIINNELTPTNSASLTMTASP